MKPPIVIIISLTFLFIAGCAADKDTGTPLPAYATYYFPVYYPAYTYAPYFDQYYEPGPYINNFNYYGYYGYWGKK
jgi:hypothetical protein